MTGLEKKSMSMVQIQGLTAENSKSVAVCECWEGKCLLTHVVKLMIQACTMSYSHLEKRSVKAVLYTYF